jgi:hypothetical protein
VIVIYAGHPILTSATWCRTIYENLSTDAFSVLLLQFTFIPYFSYIVATESSLKSFLTPHIHAEFFLFVVIVSFAARSSALLALPSPFLPSLPRLEKRKTLYIFRNAAFFTYPYFFWHRF